MFYRPPTRKERDAFHEGSSRHAYTMLGAHPAISHDLPVWNFAVWAPRAKAVSVTGEFCSWKVDAYPMEKRYDGIWELQLERQLFDPQSDKEKYNYEGAEEKLRSYKYAVLGEDGEWHLKADPYAFASELRPNNASLLYDLDGFQWGDQKWLNHRKNWNPYRSPVNIYEMHLGSWKLHEDGSMMNYIEIAEELIPYIKEMGYTHVELLPVMEHPLDMSWGYQVTGYYAPTARHGTPKEFMRFVDLLHQAGIGVILDWVPAHFPRDEVGLRQFDGTPCYEHEDWRRAEMKQWGTMMFDFGRGEVCSFLLSNACFWFEYYHIDGVRCDAVSSMLYHDFCREEGEWLPNQYGNNINIEAIAFLRRFNEVVYNDFPGVMTIAEESSAYPMVTRPTFLGGLGFGFKWNMGWMNDILSYIELDPVYRKWHHDKITFSLFYAFSENYILPFSHDEVVHGKKSMLDKNPGDLWRKFAGLRTLIGYQMAHPGKKLLFMGSEFGQFIEWDEKRPLDWFLLVYERHPELQRCIKHLNHFYRRHSMLWEIDDSWDGFEWLVADDSNNSIAIFMRMNKKGETLICMSNFTPQYIEEYRFGVPNRGTIREVFNTDLSEYGGSDKQNSEIINVEKIPWNSKKYSASICVPPLATVYFAYERIPEIPEEAKSEETEDLEDIDLLE
ncbi:MAG: 1,4-alpha-glucan branching protein GlgB [Christensenellales bacterium]|jgi:1,4-alpha-glucan branching enzyme